MLEFTRILLALLLTLSSPAWCACAFATPADEREQNSGVCGDACCPAAEQRSHEAGDDNNDGDGVPCRDRATCACCDATPITGVPGATQAAAKVKLQRSDLPLLPAVFALTAQTMFVNAGAVPDWLNAAAPPLTAATSLLARRCLLLI